MSLTEVRDALRNRKVSSVEITSQCLEHLKTIGKKLNAVASIYEEEALAKARYCDDMLASGAKGLLLGVPLGHKDMFHRNGRECSYGSKIMERYRPNSTATVLTKLDSEGAIDVARLNMVEFALGVTGHNEITGDVLNPWNTEYVTGGSSSGSGACVASRCVFGALGSDTGGSIRIPCCCCGVVGMKPTWGRVSRYGAMPLSFSLDSIGPITRTVSDNAIMLQSIAGCDSQDPSASDLAVPNYMAGLENGVKGIKLAVPKNYFLDPANDEINILFDRVLEAYKRIGADLVAVTIPESIVKTNNMTSLIISVEGASIHQEWLIKRPEEYGKQTYRRLINGLLVPATHYLKALRDRKKILKEFIAQVFTKADALLLPVLCEPAPSVEEANLGSGQEFLDLAIKLGHCTRPINYMGLPALAMPSAKSVEGVPWAHQIVGPPFSEKKLYVIGRAYEREIDWPLKQIPDCL